MFFYDLSTIPSDKGLHCTLDAKSTFQSIHSIHIYSLQPTILQDLNVLTDVGREISATYANEDPLELGQLWGMIQNENVKVCLRDRTEHLDSD